MGLKVTTDDRPVTVFRKDREWNGTTFPTYSLGISSKKVDGSWVNGYIDCEFKKGVIMQNKTQIQINNGFYKVVEGKDRKFVKVFITDYVIIKQGESEQAEGWTSEAPKQEAASDWVTIPENFADEMPFK